MEDRRRSELRWILGALILAALLLGAVIWKLPQLDELASRYAVL